jgi:hypothetical protein
MNKPPINSPIAELRGQELQAVRELVETLPDDFSWPRSLRAARADGKAYRARRRAMWAALRAAIGTIYPRLIAAGARPERFADIISACTAARITLKAPVHPAVALIRLHLRPHSDEAVNRYANCLREALLRRIPADQLALYLGKRGCGINAMSDAFKARMKRGDRPMGESAGQQQAVAAEESGEVNVTRLNVTLEWSRRGQKVWRSAKVGARPILIEKIADYRGKVHPRKAKVHIKKNQTAS